MRATLLVLFLIAARHPVIAQVPRISPEPMATIAATSPDGKVVIGRVNDADLLPDGGIVVADGTVNQLLFFDAAGALRQRAGGTGSGPGEFRRLWGVESCSGRVVAYELVAAFLERVGIDGRYLDRVRLDPPIIAMTPLRCVAQGAVVGVIDLKLGDQADPNVPVVPMQGRLIVIDSSGQQVLSMGVRDLGESMTLGPTGGMPRPAGYWLHYAALGPDLLLGTGAGPTVWLMHRGDRTERSLPFPGRQPATRADVEHEANRWLEFVPAQIRGTVSDAIGKLPLPDSLPYYREMLSSPDNTVWLLTSAPSAPRATWTITDGHRLLGAVTLPVPGDLLAIGKDRVLLLATDENGEQRLEVYGLR